jgi:hypothetical protein
MTSHVRSALWTLTFDFGINFKKNYLSPLFKVYKKSRQIFSYTTKNILGLSKYLVFVFGIWLIQRIDH